jgi:transposase
MKITTKEVRETIAMIDEIIDNYKQKSEVKKRDWRTYEQQLRHRLKYAFHQLKPLVEEAVSTIKIHKVDLRGAKPKLTIEQRVLLLLLKHLTRNSNREMEVMLIVFSILSDIDVSYKTIERFYSDEYVICALHNLHALMLKRKGIKKSNGTGDGTGYALTVKEHYCSYAQKLKDKAKSNLTNYDKKQSTPKKKSTKKKFVYSFKLLDLDTNMYTCMGSSMKSEKDAFDNAMIMLGTLEIELESIRLDRYYSSQLYADYFCKNFNCNKVYLIPKKNATVDGPWNWKRMLFNFVKNTDGYLAEYFRRNRSEGGFSEDKRRLGQKLGQKRPDRINTADFLTGLWHNLYWLGAN